MQSKEQELDQVFRTFLEKKKKPATRATYGMHLRYWIQYTGMNGEETLAFRKQDDNHDTEEKVVSFHQWMIDQGKSENTAKAACTAIRSFFRKNYVPLTLQEDQSKAIQEAGRKYQDYQLIKDDIAKMNEEGTLEERYILLAGISWGLRAGDFLAITWGTLRSLHLNDEPPVSMGEIITGKERIKAFPFCSTDAVAIIKTMLEKHKDVKDSDKVITFKEENSLTDVLNRLFDAAHLQHGDRVLRFHCCRKFLIDKLSSAASESQWKQIVGKKISEGAYVSQEQLRDVYLAAMPKILINGNGKNHAKIEELEAALVETQKQIAIKDTIIETLQKNVNHVTTESAENKSQNIQLKTVVEEISKRLSKLEGKASTTV